MRAIGPDAGVGADTVIDATGMLVTPGFIDLHTHYDAQLFWDPNASPSPLHGVTTVLGGNCGFSLAPMAPEHVDYISRMMARVEGMPLAALRAGLPWDWTSFGDWLGRLDGHIAVNAGFLVGHSTLRRLVMGERAVGGVASAADTDAMEAALDAALAEGALGFSTSQVHTHNDGDGQPVPSRAAAREELERLAAAVRRHEGTTVELIVPGCLNGFTEEEIDFLSTMSLLADRPVNWNVLGVSAMNPDGARSQLAAGSAAAARGATVVALTLPHTMQLRLSFEHGAILDGLPGVARGLRARRARAHRRRSRTPRRAGGSMPARSRTRRGSSGTSRSGTASSSRRPSPRRTPTSRAAPWARWHESAGWHRSTRCLDIVVADGLRTGLRPPIGESEADWVLRAQTWQDPRAIVGGSDAGAHLDTMCGAVYSTSMLGDGVRARGLLDWEQAVRLLTDVPARLYGLRDRGRLATGTFADVVVFDPTTIGHGPVRTRDDLPGGASRLVRGGGRHRARAGQRDRDRPRRRLHRSRPRAGVALGPRHRHGARGVRLGRGPRVTQSRRVSSATSRVAPPLR